MDAKGTTVEPPLGLVEVARLGAGPPVLVIHGTPGFDPALGILHTDKRYRGSLAHDLMEPVRLS